MTTPPGWITTLRRSQDEHEHGRKEEEMGNGRRGMSHLAHRLADPGVM